MLPSRPRWTRCLVIALVLVVLAPGAPAARGDAARAQATPVAAGDFAAMLRLVPAPAGGGWPRWTPLVSYADVAAQLAALGVAAPASPADGAAVDRWRGAVWGLTLPAAVARYGLEPSWAEALGFDLLQVDQALEYGTPPGAVVLLRGRFDEAALAAAWARSGYRVETTAAGTTASLAPEPRRIRGTWTPQTNNAAILPDGTLVFAGYEADVEAVQAAAAGRAPSLAERPGVGALLRAPGAPLAAALLVHGLDLRDQGFDPVGALVAPGADPAAAAARLATAEAARAGMPAVPLALLGMTAGGPAWDLAAGAPAALPAGQPAARLAFALLLGSRAAAETAAAVVGERLATGARPGDGRPYAELFGARAVRVAAADPVVVVELGVPGGDRRELVGLLGRRELGFLAW